MSANDKPAPIGVYKAKEMIHDMFLQSGQKELLISHIRHRTTQNGWTWTMRDEFMEYIRKRGPNNVNVSHMIADLAPLGRELFPAELKEELTDAIFEVTKSMFTIDDSLPTLHDNDDIHAGPDKTFLFQSRDIKPDPGLGIGVEIPESPPPSPQSSNSNSSTPAHSPGPITVTTTSPPLPRQSPGSARPAGSSPVSAATPRALSPQPLPPPPVLRPETGSATKSTPVIDDDEDEEEEEDDEEEPEEDDDDEDVRNNEEDDEDELMDV